MAARLYPSAYSKVERVYSLQFQSGKFSLGKSSEEGDTRAGGTECVSSEVRWGSRRAAHNGKRSLHGGGGVVQRRKAKIESERKVLKGLSRNGFEKEFP